MCWISFDAPVRTRLALVKKPNATVNAALPQARCPPVSLTTQNSSNRLEFGAARCGAFLRQDDFSNGAVFTIGTTIAPVEFGIGGQRGCERDGCNAWVV